MTGERQSSSTPIYRGWVVLAACFTTALLLIGGTLYIFQIFVLPVTEEFGISRGTINIAYMAILIGMAAWSPFVGRALDKYSARNIVMFGGILYALSLIIISRTQSLALMAWVIGIGLGLALCCSGGLAANAIVSRWFSRRRGRALGIASVASSAGGFIMLPLVTALVETQGWRTALAVMGVGGGAVVVVIAALFIRTRPGPSDLASTTEFTDTGAGSRAQASAEIESTRWTFGSLVKTSRFWLLSLGIGLLLASDQAIMTSQYPYFIELGLTPKQAALILTIMTLSAIFGKLIVGYLADQMDQRHLFAIVALFHVGLLGLLLLAPGFWALLIFLAVFGAAVGGIYPVWATLTASNFGATSFGTVFGSMALITQIMAIIFVGFIGRSYDQTGSYQLAFSLFIGAVIVAMGLVYAVKPARRG